MGEIKFMGRSAKVVIEIDMGKGRTLRVPAGDLASYTPDETHPPYGILNLAVREPLVTSLLDGVRDAYMNAGP